MKLFGFLKKSPSEFDQLCEKAKNDLEVKTEAHRQAWGLGSAKRWDLDQDVGKLVFTFPDLVVSGDAQIIGTWNSRAQTWLWAWSNPSIAAPLTQVSLKLREYGQQHGIEKLTQSKWSGTEADAWLMVALGTLLCQQQGGYRGPAGETYVFMTFSEVSVQKK